MLFRVNMPLTPQTLYLVIYGQAVDLAEDVIRSALAVYRKGTPPAAS
jgi:hypothetical protein